MNNLLEKLTTQFHQRFNRPPSLFAAPGRINLLGEHVDYNEGWVIPAAIDRHFVFAISPNGTNRFNFLAPDMGEEVSFSSNDLTKGASWSNYLMGVIAGINQMRSSIGGVDCVLSSNIPGGAGLSSSAALCSGFGFALNEIYNLGINKHDLAKIARFSEQAFAGVNCGIMDPYASLFGEKNCVLFLDCRKLEHEVIKIPLPSHAIILVDTRVKHALASTEYNDRRAACELAVTVMAKTKPHIKSLRDVSLIMLGQFEETLGVDVYIRCKFVVEEISRTQRAADLLRRGDLATFGRLMNETHWGLSRQYEVSCDELDALVTVAEEHTEWVAGSRMMGGGFGGCTINLVNKNYVGMFKELVRESFYSSFKNEPAFYEVLPSAGAHSITNTKRS